MTLPFEGKEWQNKRKFQCFVCGREFRSFPEYRDHILEEHEEGRDYVRCPLLRCGAPVRDLRSHFKAKHPTEKMPPVPQLKAMIWKDFGGKKKKGAGTKKPKFKQGDYASTKMKKNFFYRSGYELEVYQCLDILNDVVGYDVEPFKIQYVHEGKSSNYVPDLIVSFLDGHREVWEIKPSSQTHLPINEDKWHYAAKACASRDMDFVVMTEKGISKLKKQVSLQEGQKRD